MGGVFEMGVRMFSFVATAADPSTDQTLPETGCGTACFAFEWDILVVVVVDDFVFAVGQEEVFLGFGFVIGFGAAGTEVVVGVATDGTATAGPLFETGAVEDVLAEDGEESGSFVHAFEADGAGGEFD